MLKKLLVAGAIMVSAGFGAGVGTAYACPGTGPFYEVGCAMQQPPPPATCYRLLDGPGTPVITYSC